LRTAGPPASETVEPQGGKGFLWWVGQIILLLLALFFLGFGVHVLIVAYHLKDPSEFILTFFASNLMIMISGVIAIGLVLRMKRSLTLRKQDTPRAG
jgi:hypothetical protein